jgi:prepilin-type N-terminal cleavage/methylation domain-containing protein
MRFVSSPRRVRHKGLTLIELVVVIAVLAILAGFIVPRLGFVRNLAGDSGNATTIADSATQAVFYNTAEGHYPTGEDTLLNSAGTALDTYLNSGLKSVLSAAAIDTQGALSFAAQLTGSASGGTVTLYDQADINTTAPNQDDTLPVTLVASSTTFSGATDWAVVNGLTSQGAAVLQAAYGLVNLNYATDGVTGALSTAAAKDGTTLVALGYGTNSQINGKTGLEAPVLFDKKPGEYTRPILLLKVFSTGSTATGVPPGTSAATSVSISFDGTSTTANLSKYSVDQNR